MTYYEALAPLIARNLKVCYNIVSCTMYEYSFLRDAKMVIYGSSKYSIIVRGTPYIYKVSITPEAFHRIISLRGEPSLDTSLFP